jgi:hypothetical protein
MIPAIHHFARNFPMRALWAAAVCAAWLGANERARAATSTNRLPAQGAEDRYLLIVDTSAAMERNAENTQKAVTQLFSTGMVGQARPGDTIGLWTFAAELHTGVFPLQRWETQNRQKITAIAAEFMAKVRYEKQPRFEKEPRFEKVVESLTSVVKDSERITVLILTDGSARISGTPFDEKINQSYELNYAAQRKQRMPFITVLRAQGGEFIDWRVNTPPFRPEFPAFRVEPKTTEPKVEITESKPETKPESAPSTTPSPVVATERPPSVTSTPTSLPPAESAAPTATQTSVAPDVPAQPKAEVQSTPPGETTKSQPAATKETPAVVEPANVPELEAQPTTAPAPTPTEPASKPTPETPLTRKDTPPPVEAATASLTSQNPPAGEPATETTTVQTAAAAPTESLFNRTNLLIAGGVLLVVAFGCFYLLMRRAARPTEKISLITKSMDQDEHGPRSL